MNDIKKFNFDYLREIEYKIVNKQDVSSYDIEYFLDYIVFFVRNRLYDDEHPYFEYRCDLAQSIICYYLDDIGVVNYRCSSNNAINDSVVGHSFVVATFKVNGNDINYLIDPTYIQFFKAENCSELKYTIINGYIVVSPDPGYFIREEDRKIIDEFNENGYGMLTEDLARIYGNSFYNTRTMKISKDFEELKGYVYINSFIKGKEKLSRSREELLENGYYINFDKRRVK